VYPNFLLDLFTRAFTLVLHDPYSRVTENEWRKAMCRLRDAIFACPNCASPNFYDVDQMKATGSLASCWFCHAALVAPPRLRVGDCTIMLNPDSQLFPHHLDGHGFDFSTSLATVLGPPLQLKNLSDRKWTSRNGENGGLEDVQPGAIVPLTFGRKIYFGRTEGEVRL